MTGRTAREARTLGLWTAGWLGVFLLAGLLRVGDLSVQWPVLLIPALWALVASRPRRTGPIPRPDSGGGGDRRERPTPVRTDTVERSFLRDAPDERWRAREEPR